MTRSVLLTTLVTLLGMNLSCTSIRYEDEFGVVPSAEVTATLTTFQTLMMAESATASPEIRDMCERSFRAAAVLNDCSKRADAPVPEPYAKSLTNDMALIAEGLQNRETPEGLEAFRQGLKSLTIKAAHALKRRFWADLVEVRVRTMRGQQPVGGYVVMYCNRGGPRGRLYWRELRKVSTPAVDRVAPGLHEFAVPRGKAIVVHIGGKGQSKQTFDLPVPLR